MNFFEDLRRVDLLLLCNMCVRPSQITPNLRYHLREPNTLPFYRKDDYISNTRISCSHSSFEYQDAKNRLYNRRDRSSASVERVSALHTAPSTSTINLVTSKGSFISAADLHMAWATLEA
jgi:hypothetical protein